jgi:hypothetical protein
MSGYGTVYIRPTDRGTFRVIVALDAEFATVEDADAAAHYLARHLRVRCPDVLERVRASAAEEPLGEPLPRPAPAPTFRPPPD